MAATPSAAAPQQERRTTTLDDGSRVESVVMENRDRALLSINSPLSSLQIGITMSRAQLTAIRDAINAVLVSTESETDELMHWDDRF